MIYKRARGLVGMACIALTCLLVVHLKFQSANFLPDRRVWSPLRPHDRVTRWIGSNGDSTPILSNSLQPEPSLRRSAISGARSTDMIGPAFPTPPPPPSSSSSRLALGEET